jgi:hypothetical protein
MSALPSGCYPAAVWSGVLNLPIDAVRSGVQSVRWTTTDGMDIARIVPAWSKGKTADSESVDPGSNPGAGANR